MYNLEIRKQPAKFIDKLLPNQKIKVASAFEKLRENPYRRDLDIKKLHGFSDDYRLCIGKFRFLFNIGQVWKKKSL